MSKDRDQFQSRLKQIDRKHNALSAGYSARMQPDGLLVMKPRRVQSRFTGRTLVYLLVIFLLFKGFLMAALGGATYDARVQRLTTGNTVEQAGAFVMQRDPLSALIADQVAPMLR
jgi:hypothetical protein